MDDNNVKLVKFEDYCPTCKHYKDGENSEPCDSCLEVPARYYSHKPERWEGKD